MKNTAIVIFSKNRALQLDLCLGTLKNCIDDNFLEIKVLFTCSPEHKNSYETLKKEHEYVNFVEETDFKGQLLEQISDKSYVLFVCDDTIFVRGFSLEKIISQLENNKETLAFSLRLGLNTRYCYPVDHSQRLPQRIDFFDGFMRYYWPDSELDFQYVLEVSSSVYRTKDIIGILKRFDYRNPNELESVLYQNLNTFVQSHPFVLCYFDSVAFANPVNKIQVCAPSNRFSNLDDFSAENLLKLYEEGYRTDYNKFFGLIPNACHMEVDILS